MSRPITVSEYEQAIKIAHTNGMQRLDGQHHMLSDKMPPDE